MDRFDAGVHQLYFDLSPARMSELAQAIATEVAAKMIAEQALLDYKGLADWLGVSIPHIERLKREGVIPFIAIGRRVMFNRASVLAALESKVES